MTSPLRWFATAPRPRLDPVVVGGLLMVCLLWTWLDAPSWWPGVPSVLAGCALLLVRRRFPLPVLVVLGAAVFAALVSGTVTGRMLALPLLVTLWPALHAAAACPRPVTRRWAAALAVAGAAALLVTMFSTGRGERSAVYPVVLVAAYLASAWFAGAYTRIRAAYLDELRARADHAAAQERAWLARELHDMLAHTMSGMVVLAAGARRLAAQRPEVALEALEHLERTGREGMERTRQLVATLRAAEEPRERPTVAELSALTATADAAGVAVTVERDGDPAALPAPVDTAAYRIVQESLTNVLRHADATAVTVRLREHAGALDVEVADNGTPVAGRTPPGYGIAGMRERARLLGGELTAGREPHGWVVRAHLGAAP